MRTCIKNGTHLLPVDRVDSADYSRIEELVLVVSHSGGTETTIEGIDALEAVARVFDDLHQPAASAAVAAELRALRFGEVTGLKRCVLKPCAERGPRD